MGQLFLLKPYQPPHRYDGQVRCFDNLSGDIYFLTALGSRFFHSMGEFENELRFFIESKDIRNILIVQNCSCCFVTNALNEKANSVLPVEDALKSLYAEQYSAIAGENAGVDRKIALTRLNIRQQLTMMSEKEYFAARIRQNSLTVNGLVYNDSSDVFQSVYLPTAL